MEKNHINSLTFRTGILHPLATEPLQRGHEGDLHRTGRNESESLEKTFNNCR